MSCSRQLEKERDDLVRTKNNMSLDLERLLNQKEVRWFHFTRFCSAYQFVVIYQINICVRVAIIRTTFNMPG